MIFCHLLHIVLSKFDLFTANSNIRPSDKDIQSISYRNLKFLGCSFVATLGTYTCGQDDTTPATNIQHIYDSLKTGNLAPFLLAASTARWYCTVRSTRAATAAILTSVPSSPVAAAAAWSSSSDNSASQSQHPHLRYSSPKCNRNSLLDASDPSVSVGFSRLSSWLMKRPPRAFVALTLKGSIVPLVKFSPGEGGREMTY
jgi:hypothetical protein